MSVTAFNKILLENKDVTGEDIKNFLRIIIFGERVHSRSLVSPNSKAAICTFEQPGLCYFSAR